MMKVPGDAEARFHTPFRFPCFPSTAFVRGHALDGRQDKTPASGAGRRRDYQPTVAETGMRTKQFIGENTQEGYVLIVELHESQAPNGWKSASVEKTLIDTVNKRKWMKWTDFGFEQKQPPVWEAQRHYEAYTQEARKTGFKPKISGKPVVVRRKWIGKYETEVRSRTLRDAWRDERLNSYAGMEVEA